MTHIFKMEGILKQLRKDIQVIKAAEGRKAKSEEIEEAIRANQQNFETNRGQMLNNILEKPFKTISINKVIDNDKIIENPPEVKEAVRQHFCQWYKQRNHTNWPSQSWKEQYNSITQINNNTFNSISDTITETEF